jgi:hypothetical protein
VVVYRPGGAAQVRGGGGAPARRTETDFTASRPRSVLEQLLQVIDIRGSYLSRQQRRQADFLIEPPVGDIGMFEDNRVREAMDKGVLEAARRLRPAQESLILASIPKLAGGW